MVFSERIESICKQRNWAFSEMQKTKEGSHEAYYLAGQMNAYDNALVALGVKYQKVEGFITQFEFLGITKDVRS